MGRGRRRRLPWSYCLVIVSAQLLFLQQFIEPFAIVVFDQCRWFAVIVNASGETALVESAKEARLQVEHSVAIVSGQRQLEAWQTLLQGGRVDLMALRLGRTRHRDSVIPFRQIVARVVQCGLPLQNEVDLDEAGALAAMLATPREVHLPSRCRELVGRADDFD